MIYEKYIVFIEIDFYFELTISRSWLALSSMRRVGETNPMGNIFVVSFVPINCTIIL